MLLGEFEQAWRESDRLRTPGQLRSISECDGQLLVRCLRGSGDAIQFLRYGPLLCGYCSRLTVHVPERLIPLLSRAPWLDTLLPCDSHIQVNADHEIECSDLPYLFRTTVPTIPPPDIHLDLPRIHVHNSRVPLRVGLVWAAGAWNPIRSIPLEQIEPLTAINGITLCSLQRGPEAERLGELPGAGDIQVLEHQAGTILDTVAALRSLDLLISVDTMTTHLAGAIGLPVWTLLPFAADWRWRLDRFDTPWYPSVRLFRQPSPGDWTTVIRIVAVQLKRSANAAHRLKSAS